MSCRDRFWLLAVVFVHCLWPTFHARAEQLFQLRNGLVLRGSKIEIASLKEGFGAASAGESHVRPIWLIDDGLRRTYLHGKGMADGEPVDIGDLERPIELWQPTPLGGKVVAGLGNAIGVSPFNEFGRRVLTVRGPEGPVQIIQGITELNSRYAKLSALKGKPSLSWDMRVATSSIDSATLSKIFDRRIDSADLNSRLEAVRFYINAERYDDAKLALKKIIRDFPEEKDLPAQVITLTEKQGDQLLDEAKNRIASGQYALAANILNSFPLEAVGRIKKLQVEDALEELRANEQLSETVLAKLSEQMSKLPNAQTEALSGVIAEMKDKLNADTLPRFSDFLRLGDSDNLPIDNRIALGIAGWLLGSGSGEQNLSVVIALLRVRELVVEYLGDTDTVRRQQILDELKTLEGALPEYIDRMLPLLEPALAWSQESEDARVPGMYRVAMEDVDYLVQLPPEYNPLRQYPCLIALHETRSVPDRQIDWWAGEYREDLKMRLGHASRSGFIVIAPVWSREGQVLYEYTPQEHQRVLKALRHAMRRSSIDSDRIFIAGHGEGATAAWDIALAHPDLWAGMVSISGSPSKTVPHYEANSRYIPMYLVMGELDQTKADGAIIDDYMSFNHDAMVVMYRGNGRSYFYDEIQRIFEWMLLPSHTRRPMPIDIETATIRAGDQFFWWLELLDMKEGVSVDPILWEQADRIRAGKISASIGIDNQIRLKSGPADRFRLLLRPQDGIDLNEEVIVRYGSASPKRCFYDGDLKVLLEDVRQRADRKRAFWMTVDIP